MRRSIAFLSAPGRARSDVYVRERLTGISSAALETLGRPNPGVGLRLIFPATREERSEFSVRIEPYFRDLTMVFAENHARFFTPAQDPDIIERNLELAHAFLCENVAEFLAPPSSDGPVTDSES